MTRMKSRKKPNVELVIWSAYQIAALMPSDPLEAEMVAKLALEIVNRVASAPGTPGAAARFRVLSLARPAARKTAKAKRRPVRRSAA